MAIDSTQFATILGKFDTLELFGGVAIVAICATLFIVGYMARFKK